MLVRNLAAVLCSGVFAASALKLALLEDLHDSVVESTFDLRNGMQIPFGAFGVLGTGEDQGHVIENDMTPAPQKSADKTIYQVLSDNPK
jgi:hypothetical protein